MKLGSLLFAVFSLSAVRLIAATLPVTEDSFSSRGKLTAANNKVPTLRVDSTHSAYLYFKLDEVPATSASQIRYARLRLYLPKVTTNGGGLAIRVVNAAWDEALVTAEPAVDSTPLATIPAVELASKRFASVDVTATVRAWVEGSIENEGFAVTALDGAVLSVAAKEGAATGYPAELDIELNPDAGSITAAQLAPDLTLSGTTTGTFAGNGSALQSLNVANLTGQLTNNQLQNSGIALSLGPGLSGDSTVALGSTLSLTNTGVVSLTGGGGVTVSAADGEVTLGSTATSASTPGAIVQRDQSGDFSAAIISAATFEGHGALPWETITGTAQQAVANTGYLATSGNLVTLTIPPGSRVGDLVRINGVGSGGWKIVPAPGQTIAGYSAGDGPTGSSGTTGTFQYTGLNQWQLLKESQVSAGAITSTELAMNAVQSGAIAPGAVTNAKLENSSLTITAGAGLAGGGSVSLGSNVTLSNSGVTTLSGGGGITVSGSTGAITLGSNATSSNTPGSLVRRDSSGNFSVGTITGDLAGNASTANTATNFSGGLSGDVTGPQGATNVATVGGVSANDIASGTVLINAATSANVPGTLVKRDAAGNISINSLTSAGALTLPATSSLTTGLITQNGSSLIHTFGSSNFFAGRSAGNFTTTGTANTAIGAFSLNSNTTGYSNTALGSNSLLLNETGTNNTAVGTSALRENTTGDSNTAIGSASLRANTSGTFNTAIGTSALIVNVLGNSNTAVGGNALQANTTGNYNTATGESALANNITAGQNVAVGYKALAAQSYDNSGAAWNSGNVAVGYHALLSNQPTSTVAGVQNTAVGTTTLKANTIGANNTAIGFNALNANTSGGQNVAIGSSALANTTVSDGNTAVGYSALLANTVTGNTAIGTAALAANTSGLQNTAVGYQALNANTTANNNTAVGYQALTESTGTGNTALGNKALASNTGASNNTALGGSALKLNTTGTSNTAVGMEALQNNATASNNTATGFRALTANTGLNNTALGSQALLGNTTGSDNTAVGQSSLQNVATGSSNIAIGSGAGVNLTSSNSNNIMVGNPGAAGDTLTIRIGNGQTRTFIAGIRDVTTGLNDAALIRIDSNGQIGTLSSSKRYKEDIKDMGEASSRIHALRPVTFRYIKPFADGTKPIQFGLIAEEVARIFPELAIFNKEGQPETVKYHDLIPMLLNEIQVLNREKTRIGAELEAVKQRLDRLETAQ